MLLGRRGSRITGLDQFMNAKVVSELLYERNIAIGDFLDKCRIGFEQHDMKMFYRLYALEALPVPEPDDIL